MVDHCSGTERLGRDEDGDGDGDGDADADADADAYTYTDGEDDRVILGRERHDQIGSDSIIDLLIQVCLMTGNGVRAFGRLSILMASAPLRLPRKCMFKAKMACTSTDLYLVLPTRNHSTATV